VTRQIIIVGRGHGGTRAMGKTLAESGVFLGKINGVYHDHIPPFQMYMAAGMFGLCIEQIDIDMWDFAGADDYGDRFALYEDLVCRYLREFNGHDCYAWKLPETVLGLPWLVRVFPDAYYIHWVRDGRDSILTEHQSDYLQNWNVPCGAFDDRLMNAAQSWHYIESLVEFTPKPNHWISVRFEDFVLRQDETLERLGEYLGMELVKIPVIADRVGRWQREGPGNMSDYIPMMEEHMRKLGYL
jgi:hypothetical protein